VPGFEGSEVRWIGDGAIEAGHETGPVAAGRRGDHGTLGQGMPDRVEIVQPLAARIAAAKMTLHSGPIDRIELAVETEFDVRGVDELAHAHARPPVVTRALVSAPRRRCTAACSCRFTVPSASPSAVAISDNFKPS
jgi:hypothetical protein